MNQPSQPIAAYNHPDTQAKIAELAHRFYEEEGCPDGRADEHWTRAEREFHERQADEPAVGLSADEMQE
jgi:hypothetical protein